MVTYIYIGLQHLIGRVGQFIAEGHILGNAEDLARGAELYERYRLAPTHAEREQLFVAYRVGVKGAEVAGGVGQGEVAHGCILHGAMLRRALLRREDQERHDNRYPDKEYRLAVYPFLLPVCHRTKIGFLPQKSKNENFSLKNYEK